MVYKPHNNKNKTIPSKLLHDCINITITIILFFSICNYVYMLLNDPNINRGSNNPLQGNINYFIGTFLIMLILTFLIYFNLIKHHLID
jgi:magnesium-transporting ATPase (P-type)